MANWIRRITHASSAAIWLAIALLAIATSITLPNYMTGQWAWSQPPTLSGMKTLKELRKEGITLPGWQVVDQQTIELGHKQWSVQALTLSLDGQEAHASPVVTPSGVESGFEPEFSDLDPEVTERLQEEPIFIFLRPQSDPKDEPLVEWIDFNGLQRWTTDQLKSVRLLVPSSTADSTLDTRYFRGWNQNRTYAVMQWYAWLDGGSPKISDWFWADQWMQWRHHQRMPWVGVTVLVPMKPLGDLAPSQPVVEAIAQSIQTTLVQKMTASTDLQN